MGVRREKCNDGQDIFETVTIPTENVGSTGHDWQYGGGGGGRKFFVDG